MADDMQKHLSREMDMVKARHAAEVADVDARHARMQAAQQTGSAAARNAEGMAQDV